MKYLCISSDIYEHAIFFKNYYCDVTRL